MKQITYMYILRRFGALFAVLYIVAKTMTAGSSQLRQERSLVKRTYQVKLMTDKQMNKVLTMNPKDVGEKDIDNEAQMLKQTEEG